LQHINSSHTGIRQSITYGLGVYCQYGADAIVPFLDQILNYLVELITKPDSRNKTFAASTENAISSVGKIIQYHPDKINDKLKDLTRLWLTWLPIEIDLVEAKLVHKQLCQLIQTNHPFIFGDNFENLPIILNVFADIIYSKLVKKETNLQITAIIKEMQSQNPELVKTAFNSLPPNKQERLARQLN